MRLQIFSTVKFKLESQKFIFKHKSYSKLNSDLKNIKNTEILPILSSKHAIVFQINFKDTIQTRP